LAEQFDVEINPDEMKAEAVKEEQTEPAEPDASGGDDAEDQ
jgi:hypothetical protein